MTNRIRSLEVVNRSVQPATAEVWITLTPEQLTATTEVRGRLTGPRCSYSGTIEIAYPLRPLRPEQQVPGSIRLRVSLPEASLWTPACPFLYGGPVELWQDGQRCEQRQLRHGLRELALTARGVAINGRVVPLIGRRFDRCPTEDSLLALHRDGVNLLLIETASGHGVWELADRLGFLVLGQIRDTEPATLDLVRELSARPCCLGWLASAETLTTLAGRARGSWLAVPGTTTAMPTAAPRFVVGTPAERAGSPLGHLPWLLDGQGETEGLTLGSVLSE